MENIKSILSPVVDNLAQSGLLDVTEFTRDPYTKTETKNNIMYTSESGTAGACKLKAKVLVGSSLDNVLRSKESLMSGNYSFTINNDFFKALSCCDSLVDMFGSLNVTMTVTSTVAETQPNFSREASVSDKLSRIYTLEGRCDVEPNFISA